MFCTLTSFLQALKSTLLTHLYLPWMLLLRSCFYTTPFFFFFKNTDFFALCSSIVKPFSVTSKKNYVPSFSKSFVTRPTPPCHNPCAAMRLMPASGQPSTAASTSHFFCIQICTFVFPLKLSSCQEDLSANTLKVTSASFFQNSQKSIFDRNFFFCQWLSSHVPRLLSIILTTTVLLSPSASPSVCSQSMRDKRIANCLEPGLSSFSSFSIHAEPCMWGSCFITRSTRGFDYYNNDNKIISHTWGSDSAFIFPSQC